MQDREIMENILLNLKGECDLYMHGAIESATQSVRAAFNTALTDTLNMQAQVYDKMAAKGWYPTSPAEQKQIDAVKQKFAAGC